jgi:serine/threonine protein kinase
MCYAVPCRAVPCCGVLRAQVLHSDLKARNVLLKSDASGRGCIAKVADFGLAQTVDCMETHVSAFQVWTGQGVQGGGVCASAGGGGWSGPDGGLHGDTRVSLPGACSAGHEGGTCAWAGGGGGRVQKREGCGAGQ